MTKAHSYRVVLVAFIVGFFVTETVQAGRCNNRRCDHGDCTSSVWGSTCICHPGWQGNQCDEAVKGTWGEWTYVDDSCTCTRTRDCSNAICSDGGVQEVPAETAVDEFCPADGCDNAVDIAFLLDDSNCVNTMGTWSDVTGFVSWVVQQFMLQVIRASVTLYNQPDQARQKVSFRTPPGNLKQVISSLSMGGGAAGNLADAMTFVRTQVFQRANGDRLDVPNVLVMVVCASSLNGDLQDIVDEASLLKNSSVHIIVVVVGDNPDLTLANDIASSADDVLISNTTSDLDSHIHQVAFTSCTLGVPYKDPCHYCKHFDDDGFGFIAHPDLEQCHMYVICRRRGHRQPVEHVADMECPYNLVYSPEGGTIGVPCAAIPAEGLPEYCEDRAPPTTPPITAVWGCPYKRSPSNDADYGEYNQNGQFVLINTCGRNKYFDEQACTCQPTITGETCNCRLYLPFENDIKGQGCNRAFVMNSPDPVVITQSGIWGNAAKFSGYRRAAKAGTYLKSWILDGAFGDSCGDNWGYKTMTVSLWIRPLNKGADVQGLIDYGDCLHGSSFYIKLINHTIACVGLKTQGHDIVHLCDSTPMAIGQWTFIAMIFEASTLSLYVVPQQDFPSCSQPNPPQSCSPVKQAPLDGCIESRDCGVIFGNAGHKNYYVGKMDDVKISTDASFYACEEHLR